MRRWRRSIRLGIAGAALWTLAGCAQTFDTTSLGVPVTMAAPAAQPPAGQSFEVTSHAVFGLWGLVPLSHPSLERALAHQLLNGSGVADLKIRVRSRLSDVIISVLTLGLVVPRSVTFQGVVTGGAPAAP